MCFLLWIVKKYAQLCWTIRYRDIKASGIYFVLYELMSGETKDSLSPVSAIRIVFAGGLAG